MGLAMPLLSCTDCQKTVYDIEGMWLSKKDADFHFVKPNSFMKRWKYNYI